MDFDLGLLVPQVVIDAFGDNLGAHVLQKLVAKFAVNPVEGFLKSYVIKIRWG